MSINKELEKLYWKNFNEKEAARSEKDAAKKTTATKKQDSLCW